MREKGDERRKSDDKSAARKKREEWESKREERREGRENGSSKGSKGTRHQRGQTEKIREKDGKGGGQCGHARPTRGRPQGWPALRVPRAETRLTVYRSLP